MEIETFSHSGQRGWSVPLLPELDSDRTLVVVFGASAAIDDPERVRELMAAYPRAHVIGCSTAGEIFDSSIHDDSLSVAVCRFGKTTLRSSSAPAPRNRERPGCSWGTRWSRRICGAFS